LLAKCLDHLLRQQTSRTVEIVVVDNDRERTASEVVERHRGAARARNIDIVYAVEPVQNIALARNRSVALARAPLIAFIDDDEYPSAEWLDALCVVLEESGADGVVGPVESVFPPSFPEWLRTGRVFARRRHKTGVRLRGGTCPTNNILVRSATLGMRAGPFDPGLGKTGGSDAELFDDLDRRGARFVWCDDAVAYEMQSEERRTLRWHFRRGYRVGWGYARIECRKRGAPVGQLVVLGNAALATAKLILLTLADVTTPRAAGYYFVHRSARQLGKIGYFAGIGITEYDGSSGRDTQER
jgi:hypothetical protein